MIDGTHNCPSHGAQAVKLVMGYNGWIGDECPACKEEAEADSRRLTIQRDADRAEQDKRLEPQRIAAAIARLKEISRIPQRFADKTFANFIPACQPSRVILETCQRYAEEFPHVSRKGSSLILCGYAGAGKTHLACATARAIIEAHQATVIFTKVSKAIRSVKETYSRNSDRDEQQAIDALVSPDLLILDEVGVQFGSDTEKNILFEIINERYEAMKPTILISNLALKSLTEFTGERVIDRMKENGGALLIFDWLSMRGK